MRINVFSFLMINFLISCAENSDSEKKEISKNNLISCDEKPFKPEYPLVGFYLNDKISDVNKTEKGFPDGVNDLKIDKSNSATVLVSFDREGWIGCEWRGKMSPNFKNGKYDTIFLDYYTICKSENDIVEESIELRYYFEIVDGSIYEGRVFMPRQIEQPLP
jgi:hypothetical protein